MKISRREMITLMGMTAAAGLMNSSARAQTTSTTTQPLPRMPLDEFVKSEKRVAALRKGVKEMKRRKPSDPLSWFYQAAIHGVLPDVVKTAASGDPDVLKVPPERWNQCPHGGQHSANFLPWHRGYTYYFERILRMHTEDDTFSLPYWNYHDKANRKFPKEFGVEHLDGNVNNNDPENINPLHLPQRDFYLCTYEHSFVKPFEPLLELSDFAVDITIPMNSPVFFGVTEQEGLGGGIYDDKPSTRGLLESYPHDQIHRSVGGIVISHEVDPETGEFKAAVGAMAQPPTAGFDPIFPVHHSNIDRLWAKWACMPGKQWGALPPDSWFNEKPWIFYDIDGKEVNEPRKKYFDHRALGVRFQDEDLSCTPLQLPDSIMKGTGEILTVPRLSLVARSQQTLSSRQSLSLGNAPLTVSGLQRSVIPVSESVKQGLRNPAANFRAKLRANRNFLETNTTDRRLFVRLLDLSLNSLHGTGFDVHVTNNPQAPLSRADASFVGSISLFNHPESHDRHNMNNMNSSTEERSQSFEITGAVAAVGNENLEGLSVVLVPYSLLSSPQKQVIFVGPNAMRLGGIEFFML
jgi:hypothetical protein